MKKAKEDHGSQTNRHTHHQHADESWTRDEALATLENPERRRILDPDQFWNRVVIVPGSVVVEVGAGAGYFAIPAGRRVGNQGRVYATDISEAMVKILSERRLTENLPQLLPIRNTSDHIPLPSEMADLVLLANVLHDISHGTVTEAVRILRPGRRFVNLDWKKVETPGGPPLDIRLSPDEAAKLLTAHGLVETERFDTGPYHYAQLFHKAGKPTRPGC